METLSFSALESSTEGATRMKIGGWAIQRREI
jgi:hypothetical protein